MSTVAKTSNKVAVSSSNSIAALYASSASVTAFWITIILKESYTGFSNLLNFYKPVGPLLGLFLLALFVFAAVYYAVNSKLDGAKVASLRKHSQKSITVFMVSTILVFFMTFPPVFDFFVEILK